MSLMDNIVTEKELQELRARKQTGNYSRLKTEAEKILKILREDPSKIAYTSMFDVCEHFRRAGFKVEDCSQYNEIEWGISVP